MHAYAKNKNIIKVQEVWEEMLAAGITPGVLDHQVQICIIPLTLLSAPALLTQKLCGAMHYCCPVHECYILMCVFFMKTT